MRKPSYQLMIFALAATVVAPSMTAIAQQGSDQRDQQSETSETSRLPTVTPQEKPPQTFYYRPGDIKGVPYETIEECSQARQRDGDVGVCVMR